jgi:hypothetical protein
MMIIERPKYNSKPIPIPRKKTSRPKNYNSYELKNYSLMLVSHSPDVSLANSTPPPNSPLKKEAIKKLLIFLSNN